MPSYCSPDEMWRSAYPKINRDHPRARGLRQCFTPILGNPNEIHEHISHGRNNLIKKSEAAFNLDIFDQGFDPYLGTFWSRNGDYAQDADGRNPHWSDRNRYQNQTSRYWGSPYGRCTLGYRIRWTSSDTNNNWYTIFEHDRFDTGAWLHTGFQVSDGSFNVTMRGAGSPAAGRGYDIDYGSGTDLLNKFHDVWITIYAQHNEAAANSHLYLDGVLEADESNTLTRNDTINSQADGIKIGSAGATDEDIEACNMKFAELTYYDRMLTEGEMIEYSDVTTWRDMYAEWHPLPKNFFVPAAVGGGTAPPPHYHHRHHNLAG